MANSVFSYFTSFFGQFGEALIGRHNLTALANFTLGYANGIVAFPGGAQAGSPVLQYGDNQVDTVASANDSVQMPLALLGAEFSVINAGAQTMRLYANGATNPNNGNVLDQIVANATVAKTANVTPITLASGYAVFFTCVSSGIWKQFAAAS